MDFAQRLMLYEPVQPFQTQDELPRSQREFAAKSALAEPFNVLRCIVVRTVDYPEIIPPTDFHSGLDQTL